MKHFYTRILLLICLVLSAYLGCSAKKSIVIADQLTTKIYRHITIRNGDILIFEWVHSFEHIGWKEFYRIKADNTFELYTIAVEGFGAGIPAEMDCTYRYENGMIYMENIQGSSFKNFRWIHSQIHLKQILLNGNMLITGNDLPERKKILLKIQ